MSIWNKVDGIWTCTLGGFVFQFETDEAAMSFQQFLFEFNL